MSIQRRCFVKEVFSYMSEEIIPVNKEFTVLGFVRETYDTLAILEAEDGSVSTFAIKWIKMLPEHLNKP